MKIAKKLSLVAVFASLSLFGCKQGEGETCQIDSDCEDGLTCNLAPGGERFCTGTGGVADPPDASPPRPDADLTIPDAAPPTPDAAAPDAAVPDAAAPDAAPSV